MKTTVSTIIFLAFIFLVSCSKIENANKLETTDPEIPSTTSIQKSAESPVTFCEETIMALCWKKSNLQVGYIKIKRGSDNNLYVSFRTAPSFYFMEVNLFCGQAVALPASFTHFPYRMSFAAPFPSQEQNFIVNNPSATCMIVAEALVVKKASNGNITSDIKQGWANGCNGPNLCEQTGHDKNNTCGDLSGGSSFTYSDPGNCFIQGPTIAVEPDLCSYPIACYFGVHPLYNTLLAWKVPSVNVGSFYYSEKEGRALADSTDAVMDAKYVFLRVATLKLSNTGYVMSPTLSAAVQTIETWLETVGKLNPATSIPANNTVNQATKVLDQFISAHQCPWRIE